MKSEIFNLIFFVLFVVTVGAYPISDEVTDPISDEVMRLLPKKIDNITKSVSLPNQGLTLNGKDESFTNGIYDDVKNLLGVLESVDDMFKSTVPKVSQQSLTKLIEYWESVFTSNVLKLTLLNITQLIFEGNGIEYILSDFSGKINSFNNTNTEEPKFEIYPSSNKDDAPYSFTEKELRSALYIPSKFEYGKGSKQIVLLVPGTGTYGGNAFHSNYIKLLDNTDFADPVWLNIPNHLMSDGQGNAEYVAYAVNYISSITDNHNVSVISWSQGGLDVQWALKYWPSIREHVSNFIPISPDFLGTKMAYLICPSYPDVPCAPSVLQQRYDSSFVRTLRDDDGDSAYVPTTSIYSGFDEIVEPQSGNNASAILKDNRNVGVGNFQFQKLCPHGTAGRYYTHEGALYNPVGYGLAVDAIKNGGPGRTSRIDLEKLCEEPYAEGLNGDDVATTELDLLYAGFYLIFLNKVTREPEIKKYAQN